MIWDRLWKIQENRIASGSNAGPEGGSLSSTLPRIMGGGLTFHFDQGEASRHRCASGWSGTALKRLKVPRTWRLRGGGLPLAPFSALQQLRRLSQPHPFFCIYSLLLPVHPTHHTPSPPSLSFFVTLVVDLQNAFLRRHRPRLCGRRPRPDRRLQCHHQAQGERESPCRLDLRGRLAARPRKVHRPRHHRPRRRRHPADPLDHRDPCQ